jgi:hypothetical protein
MAKQVFMAILTTSCDCPVGLKTGAGFQPSGENLPTLV